MRRRRHHRGQALVLFSLFLLVLVVMVLATLSLGHLTHRKMELQVAGDTAAYSQAVATARAYNSVALLNRAQVATMVALSGVASVTSFAGSYRGAVNATWYAYVDEFDSEYCGTHNMSGPLLSSPRQLCEGNVYSVPVDCQGAAHGLDAIDRQFCYGPACPVSLAIFGWGSSTPGTQSPFNNNARLPLIRLEFDRLTNLWQALDDAVGDQGRNIAKEAASYAGLQVAALAEGQAALAPLTDRSFAATQGTARGPSVGISNREFSAGTSGGLGANSLEAAMGSRAHGFITRREDGIPAIEGQIRRVLAPSGAANEVVFSAMQGNGYFARTKNHGARPAAGYAAWGDEHASVSVDYAGPSRFVVNGAVGASGTHTFEGHLGATDLQNTSDQHDWCPGDFHFQEAVNPPEERHTLPPHTMNPDGTDPCRDSSCIWPSFRDTNAGNLTNAADAFGQPKLLAAGSHDLSGDKDPWNLFFKFSFTASTGTTTDLRASHAVAGVAPAMESLSAGMAYYHRPGHWQEPPNLFNPYWRATLVRANVDDTWLGDVAASLSPQNAAALQALDGAGFRGVP